uniref:(California timema) hypothetical protein n=1 Tax=Timema californicum TaxID=61474 RepID=A0A7R9IZA9_TIMCA|nr:unnamed protein product [Timema californicum]
MSSRLEHKASCIAIRAIRLGLGLRRAGTVGKFGTSILSSCRVANVVQLPLAWIEALVLAVSGPRATPPLRAQLLLVRATPAEGRPTRKRNGDATDSSDPRKLPSLQEHGLTCALCSPSKHTQDCCSLSARASPVSREWCGRVDSLSIPSHEWDHDDKWVIAPLGRVGVEVPLNPVALPPTALSGDSGVQRSFTVAASDWKSKLLEYRDTTLLPHIGGYADLVWPGILEDIKTHYNIGNDRSGLLQTAFVLSYMVFAPLFGYLGDRYSRKYIMAFGITLWSLTTLLGSFANTYDLFITSRALVGIGEASYSTIAPTIISDMFVGQLRSIMLALFYFAIPVGSGLGYIVGSETARATNQWQWGLRVTPIVGCVAVLLVLLVLKDPVRGESEGSNLTPTPWKQDIKQLARNKTFMLTTAGFTCVAFVTGALAWWGPTFIWQGQVLYLGEENVKFSVISYKFGIIAMVSGLIGVPLGSFIAQTLRSRVSNVDPLVCAAGMLISTPLLYVAMLTARAQVEICYTLMFLGELVLNLNWSIVADMVLVSVLCE